MHIALSAQSNRNSNINDLREAAGRGRVKEELEKANIWLLDEAACNEQSGRWEPPAKENEKSPFAEHYIHTGHVRVPSAAAAIKALRFARPLRGADAALTAVLAAGQRRS
jgi:hypothetical protein